MGKTVMVAMFATTDADWKPVHDLYISTARKVLKAHDMNLEAPSTPIGGSMRILPFTGPVFLEPGDHAKVRYLAHQNLPVGLGIPVIFARLNTASASQPRLGLTIKTHEGVATNGVPWLPYILVNTQDVSRSGETLVHEMIHAAYEPGGRVHDKDAKSVFFEFGNGENERYLPVEHATALSKAYFAA
jgi:hypothetical protein